MKTKTYIIILCLLLISGVGMSYAQHISINKAIDIGVRFFEQEAVNSNSPRHVSAMGGNLMATASGKNILTDICETIIIYAI